MCNSILLLGDIPRAPNLDQDCQQLVGGLKVRSEVSRASLKGLKIEEG